jgi:crossover junction endodeoxyribonuclease RusA
MGRPREEHRVRVVYLSEPWLGGVVVRVTLELPFPPAELSPNAREGWRKKARITREYREDCGWTGKQLTMNGEPSLTPPVRAEVVFVVPTRHRRDLDNLLASLKPAWDGLCDAGVLEGDDAERFSVTRSEVRYEKGRSMVLVSLSHDGGSE